MEVVKEEGVDHHPELAEELQGVDTEQMIMGTEVVENELSEAQRVEEDNRNSNMTTGTTGVTTIVDEAPYVVIYE